MVKNMDKTIDISYTMTEKFDFKRLFDILVGALEGGSNDWYHIAKITPPKNLDNIDTKYMIYNALLNEGGSLEVVKMDECDVNDLKIWRKIPDTAKRYIINIESIKKGLELMSKNHPTDFLSFVKETDDATTSDILFQLICFGKIVYC